MSPRCRILSMMRPVPRTRDQVSPARLERVRRLVRRACPRVAMRREELWCSRRCIDMLGRLINSLRTSRNKEIKMSRSLWETNLQDIVDTRRPRCFPGDNMRTIRRHRLRELSSRKSFVSWMLRHTGTVGRSIRCVSAGSSSLQIRRSK